MTSPEGHFCENCWCDQEHGCVCGLCGVSEEQFKAEYLGYAVVGSRYESVGVVHPAKFYCDLCKTWFECVDLDQEYVDHVWEFHD